MSRIPVQTAAKIRPTTASAGTKSPHAIVATCSPTARPSPHGRRCSPDATTIATASPQIRPTPSGVAPTPNLGSTSNASPTTIASRTRTAA